MEVGISRMLEKVEVATFLATTLGYSIAEAG